MTGWMRCVVTAIAVFVMSAPFAWGAANDESRVAVVNGTAIMKDEFDGELLLMQRTLLGAGKPLSCSQIEAIGTEVLESMIRRELLYQESRKAGITADQSALARELDAVRKQFATEADYHKELARRNITEERFRARLEQNLAVQAYIEKAFVPKAVVPDSDAEAYYQKRPDLFTQPLQVRVSHILIQSDEKWPAAKKQEARKKAEQILKSLRKGKDFAMIAREQSDGPTRTSGGDLGYIRKGQLDAAFENTVFSMKQGDISDVIETPYGFHIFRVADRQPETVLKYAEVKDRILQVLRSEKARQDADLAARALREKATVQTFLSRDAATAKRH